MPCLTEAVATGVGVGCEQLQASPRLYPSGFVPAPLGPTFTSLVSLTTALPSGTDMAQPITTQLLLLLVWGSAVWAVQPRTELLNVCMDAKHHKEKPSPEDKLHEQV